MAEYLSPGVYVEEFESGGKTMEGVGTSTAGFIGLAERGPVEGAPQLVTSFADFKRTYGGYLSEKEFGEYRFLAYAIEHFFINGGSRCFVARVAPQNAKCAEGSVATETPIISFKAKNPGVWGDNIRVVFTPASKAKTQILEVQTVKEGKKYIVKSSAGFNVGDVVRFSDGETTEYNRVVKIQDNMIVFENEFTSDVEDDKLLPTKVITTCEITLQVKYDDIVETYENISFNVEAPNDLSKMIAKSKLITGNYHPKEIEEIIPPYQLLQDGEERAAVTISLSGGSNGAVSNLSSRDFIGSDNGAGKRTGIQAFLDNNRVSLMAVPGIVDAKVQHSLIAHCENLGSRFAVLDMPKDSKKIEDILKHRDMFDSSYAAMYHPWLEIFDPLNKKNIAIPPSGSLLGIYARTDNDRGVHKAPANEVVRSCIGLAYQFNKEDQDILNPKGVNLIRSFSGQGIRVWGARTLSNNANWKYINVRRLLNFIEETIKASTNWVVFEPNNEVLWVRVKRTINTFLTEVWRSGALAGYSSDEAFFVNVDRSTMCQDDINNGRLICAIGVAPIKPAEFIIFRITHKTGESCGKNF